MKTIIIYLLSFFQIMIRGIVSVALISVGFFCLSLAMGTGGPSNFLVNLGIHILLFIAGMLSGVIGTIILIPGVKISWTVILYMFRLSRN